MKRLVLCLTLLSAACAHPSSLTTPQGQMAYTADHVVLRVNELQNAAIQANRGGALPDATTRVIVTFCVDADKTLAATPSGWQQTVSTAWRAAKQQIPPVSNPALAAAISAVDVVLASFGGGQ